MKNFQFTFNGNVCIQAVRLAVNSPLSLVLNDILIRFVSLQSIQLITVFRYLTALTRTFPFEIEQQLTFMDIHIPLTRKGNGINTAIHHNSASTAIHHNSASIADYLNEKLSTSAS